MVSDDKSGSFKCPCCTFCKDCAGFQKVAELKDIGLVIYRHVASSSAAPDKQGSQKDSLPAKTDESSLQPRSEQPPKTSLPTKEVFIVQNIKDVEITSADFVPEFERNKVNCPRCERIMTHAQELLQNVRVIQKKDVRGICDHCRLKQSTRSMCYICEKIVKKFTATKEKMDREEIMRKRLEAFLGKVHKLWEADYKRKGRAYTDDDMDQFKRRRYTDDDKLMIQPVPCPFMPPSHKQAKSIIPCLPCEAMRKYHSDDSLVTSFTDIHEEDYKKHMKYFFPGTTKKGKYDKDYAAGKSSTTLFKDTQSRLQSEADKKRKEEEDLRRKRGSLLDDDNYEIDPITGKRIKKRSGADDGSYEIDPITGKRIKKKSAGDDASYEIDPITGKKIKKKSATGDEYEIDPKTGKKVKKKSAGDDDGYEIDPKTGKKIKKKSATGDEYEIDPKTGKKIKKTGKGTEGDAGDSKKSGKKDKDKDLPASRFAKELEKKDKEKELHEKGKLKQEETKKEAHERADLTTKPAEDKGPMKDAKEKMKELRSKGSKHKVGHKDLGSDSHKGLSGEGSRSRKDLALKDVKTVRPDADDLILKLVQVKRVEKLPDIKTEGLWIPRIPEKSLRRRKSRLSVVKEGPSQSEIDLDNESLLNKRQAGVTDEEEIIVHQEIVPKTDVPIKPPKEVEAALFKFTLEKPEEDTLMEPIPPGQELADRAKTAPKAVIEESATGIVRYALSDRTFIDNGWTMLPTEKIVRKMNVYRMRPARPDFCWFENNRKKGLMQYDTGEKLADFDEFGGGRWFYRNGKLALDYYDADDINTQQRFIVYSNGEPDEKGRPRPHTVLAMFDYLGNGIIFDHAGKIRLKYNQSEGIVLDRELGPMSHWKWHSLNDPPVLQQVMIDTHLAYKDPDIINIGDPNDNKVRQDNEEMLAIEFDNFIKEKSQKSSQKYKPFQIKMKAVKINENFSLRIMNQSTIHLTFRDGPTSLKLNLGLTLDPQEIVDTDNAELGEVPTDLDRLPAKTDSMAQMQRNMGIAKRIVRMQTERERRLRPPQPVASVDRLVAATSRPLRPPLQLLPSTDEIGAGDSCPCKRKKSNQLIQ